MVDQNSASWNRLLEWLTQVGTLRAAIHPAFLPDNLALSLRGPVRFR